MPLKIRLQRQGKKKQSYYHIVVADSRSPRDGRSIERLGSYNPHLEHEGVVIDENKTLQWMEKGALPTDTCRNILSAKGIMLRKHLLKGVKKGLFTQEEADAKFLKWDTERAKLHSEAKEKKAAVHKDIHAKRFEAEKVKKEARAKSIADKKIPPPAPEEAKPEENAAAETPQNESAAPAKE
jgi:small subunit ribosomal protein S16